MKRLIFVVGILAIIINCCLAQDLIIKKNGDRIECKIISEDSTSIYFTALIKDNETYTYIFKSNVLKVKYANGDVKLFTAYSDSIQIKNNWLGNKYYLNGELLNSNGLYEVLKVNNQALRLYDDSRSMNSLAMILGIAGGSLIGYTLGTAGSDPNWIIAGVGAGLVVIAIPISKFSDNAMQEAVITYNNGLGKTSMIKYEIKLGITCNGLGLVMRF